jgi:uncharacterized DUF497 family protein
MLLQVQWNAARSSGNVREHGVSFAEAATVLGDPLSRTIPDSAHAADQTRFVTLGLSHRARMLVVSHLDRGGAVWILAAERAIRTNATRRTSPGADYDFSTGARGKYAARYWEAAASRPRLSELRTKN